MSEHNLVELIKARHSCRSFLPSKVDDATVKEILAAGRCAASAHGTRDTITVIVESKEAREKLEKRVSEFMGGYPQPFYGAPHIAAVLAKKNLRLGCGAFDGALVLGNMMLAAYALGVGSCWINTAQYDTSDKNHSVLLEITRTQLNLGDEWDGVGYLAFGYPADKDFFNKSSTEANLEKVHWI